MNLPPVSLNDGCPDPKGFWTDFISNTVAFCQRYVQIIERFPEFRTRTIEEGIMSAYQLDKFEKLGRGQILPKIATSSGTQYQRLLHAPLSVQREAVENGIEVLEPDGATRMIPLDDLTPEQARQAVGRSIAQQRTWLNEHRPSIGRKQEEVRVLRDGVIFHGEKISKRTLLQWLQEIG